MRMRLLAFGAGLALLATGGPTLADPAPDVAEAVERGEAAWMAGDDLTAVTLWREAATAGSVEARFLLAEAYRLGRGLPRDLDIALMLYRQAAELGHQEAADNYGLLLYESGPESEAMPFVRQAAARGDARARYILGLAHYNADLAERDWPRAYALVILAEASGLAEAARARVQMDSFIPAAERAAGRRLALELDQPVEVSPPRPPVRLPGPSSDKPGPVSGTGGLGIAGQQQAAAPPPADNMNDAAEPDPRPPERIALPAPSAAAAPPAVAMARAAPSTPLATEAPGRGDWVVQLGAFSNPANAERMWRKLASHPALAGAERFEEREGRLTVLIAGGFAGLAEARAACVALKASGEDCLVRR
jgi:cell division septation protein DedD